MPLLTLDSVVSRGANHVEAEIGEQVFMMNLDQGKYFAIDGVARRIWSLIDKPVPVAYVVAALSEEFEVEPARCRSEVLAFVEDLLRGGLVVEIRN